MCFNSILLNQESQLSNDEIITSVYSSRNKVYSSSQNPLVCFSVWISYFRFLGETNNNKYKGNRNRNIELKDKLYFIKHTCYLQCNFNMPVFIFHIHIFIVITKRKRKLKLNSAVRFLTRSLPQYKMTIPTILYSGASFLSTSSKTTPL